MSRDELRRLQAERAEVSAAMSTYANRIGSDRVYRGGRAFEDVAQARAEFDRNARRLGEIDAAIVLARRSTLPTGGHP